MRNPQSDKALSGSFYFLPSEDLLRIKQLCAWYKGCMHKAKVFSLTGCKQGIFKKGKPFSIAADKFNYTSPSKGCVVHLHCLSDEAIL